MWLLSGTRVYTRKKESLFVLHGNHIFVLTTIFFALKKLFCCAILLLPVSFLKCSFNSTDDVLKLRRCITAAFFANAVRLHYTGVYRTVRDGHELYIHPSSVLSNEEQPQWYIRVLHFGCFLSFVFSPSSSLSLSLFYLTFFLFPCKQSFLRSCIYIYE